MPSCPGDFVDCREYLMQDRQQEYIVIMGDLKKHGSNPE
jgi:hypothetical protein